MSELWRVLLTTLATAAVMLLIMGSVFILLG